MQRLLSQAYQASTTAEHCCGTGACNSAQQMCLNDTYARVPNCEHNAHRIEVKTIQLESVC